MNQHHTSHRRPCRRWALLVALAAASFAPLLPTAPVAAHMKGMAAFAALLLHGPRRAHSVRRWLGDWFVAGESERKEASNAAFLIKQLGTAAAATS